jgi:hypothetical protein
MIEKIVININTDITGKQSMNLATSVTTKYCYAWMDTLDNEWNPEHKKFSDATLEVVIISSHNEWVFYFEGNEVSVND